MSATIALAVPHCPWISERAASMQRLREQLGVERGVGDTRPLVCASYREFTDKEPNAVWSEKLWTWVVDTGADYCLQLQDDVEVAPNFWPSLRAMLEAVPEQVIGLAAVLPILAPLAAEGHRWVTSAEHLIGWAYCLPRPLLAQFLKWRRTKLKAGALDVLHEDDLLGCWCLATGRKVWHPIPTIVQHDTSLESSYGNDSHVLRRSVVAWESAAWRGEELGQEVSTAAQSLGCCDWTPSDDAPPHIGLGYAEGNIARACLQWVQGFTEADYARAMRDDGRDLKRRIVLEARVREMRAGQPSAAPRIMLCTPTRGGVHPHYARSVWLASRMQDVEFEQPFELHQATMQHADVVMRRSQFVRQFLESQATHLFFVDSDIEFSPQALAGMLETGKDFVACPYPMRDFLRWPKADEGPHPEATAYRYALHLAGEGLSLEADGTAEVARIGLGCTLLSRACLEKMSTHYEAQMARFRAALHLVQGPPEALEAIEKLLELSDLNFLDGEGPGGVPTVALFQLMVRDQKLRSEDQSFCQRWRDIGGKVWMYLGRGSPVTHHGEHAYRGYIEAFGLRRV